MMRIALVGATGRIGRFASQRAAARGLSVVALTRTHSPDGASQVEWHTGDVSDPVAVRRLVTGCDAIVAALGPRSNAADSARKIELGMRHLVAAAAGAGIRRIVTLSGAGISVPDDHKPLIDRSASAIVRRVARYVVEATQRVYEVLAASDLDWTALRPPLVGDGPAQGYRLSARLEPGARVRREDVGNALIDVLIDESTIRTAPFVLPLLESRATRRGAGFG